MEILKGIGLTEPQAKAYLKLLDYGESTPPELAEVLGETRTNMYSILDQLEKKSLVTKDTKGKKISYSPKHPINIEAYVERRRNTILNWEYKLKGILPEMIKNYFATTQQPEVRFFQGREALETIYDEIIEEGKELSVIVPMQEHEFLGEKFIEEFITKRIKNKIHANVLSPKLKGDKPHLKNDKAHLIKRYWYHPEKYQSPVEINIFGDKVAYLSFGEEIMGTVIYSPQIAQSARELFEMVKTLN